MPIIDTIRRVEREGGVLVSLEFFPARTAAGVCSLLRRVQQTVHRLRPHFVSVTWRAQFKDEDLWLSIGSQIQRDLGVDVLMHLTCHLPAADISRILKRCRDAGIRNILALRGDPPIGSDEWRPAPGGLRHAHELVELIRREHGDFFCVAVAGYPEVHLESRNSPALPPSEQARALDIARLKAKCDAGAAFVITQHFYDTPLLLEFVAAARAAGVRVPIIPGYLPVQNYASYSKFVSWCRTHVPSQMRADLEAVRDDDAAVKAYGEKAARIAVRQLIAGGVRAVHFFTLNLVDAVQHILDDLGLVPADATALLPRTAAVCEAGPLTLQSPVQAGDASAASPIFWANRAAHRPQAFENEFPNGRWTLSSSPAFGELSDYYLAAKRPKLDRRAVWGTPQSAADVARVFVAYIDGTVPQLPWCDASLAPESSHISTPLRWLNEAGILTINSQPRVNGVSSGDPRFGWGGPGGVVYQKAYLEAWVPPDIFERFLAALPRFPSLGVHAINSAGEERLNTPPDRACAVTWGVWPGREVLQPTVVDPRSFRVWAHEAFELWRTQWQSLYTDATAPADAAARRVLQEIHDTYWLLNVVDNEYVSPASDVFAAFREVVVDALPPAALRARVLQLEADNAGLRDALVRVRDELAASAAALQRARAAQAAAESEARALRPLAPPERWVDGGKGEAGGAAAFVSGVPRTPRVPW